ncbi:MotB family protein [Methylorubrum extorquens]
MSDRPHEIIIIKRHGDHEEGHHGGAWKIALADFMTAMMALFLVMWLINSTSKEQKQTIAEYFNPVKLAEVTHDRKGVNDPQDTPNDPAPSGKGKGDGGNAEGKGDAAGAPGSRARESALFQDPYAVLAKLAAEAEAAGPEAASADASALEAGQPGVAGGETGRDPFDPLYWQVAALPRRRTDNPGALDSAAAAPADSRLDARAQTAGSKPTEPQKESAKDIARQSLSDAMRQAGVKLASAEPMPLTIPSAEPAKPSAEAAPLASPAEAKPAPPEPTLLAKAEAPPAKDFAPAKDLAPAKELAAPADQAAKAAETAALSALKAEIARAVPSLPNGAPAPQVEVRRTGEGVLISITDEINYSMFGIGSAEPTPKVVKALERIAKILNSRPGRVVVRGHTDGRPFRSETYDNWRLSSARAQMASYMLVRGGLDEARIDRIEGYADRQPRIASNPKAAENRRIEILLRGLPE